MINFTPVNPTPSHIPNQVSKKAFIKPVPFQPKTSYVDQSKIKKKRSIKPQHSRKIVDAKKNLAPTVDHPTDLKDSIKEHAHLRIQLFYLTAIALYKRACRTDGTLTDVKVTVTGATMQVGQGNRENHAAHANASASIVDDLKKHILVQIQKEGLTPQKKKILKAKGLSDRDLNAINQNHSNDKFIEDLISSLWPHDSLLKGTELELTLNTTNHLPAGLNLGCDLPLEKQIRPYIGKQLNLVMIGLLDPQKATSDYILQIQDHFKKKITELQNEIKLCSNNQKISRLKEILLYHQMELEGSVGIDFDHLQKEFEIPDNSKSIDPSVTLRLLKPLK